MGLLVELPMALRGDNRGAVNIAKNWSSSDHTRHMDARLYLLKDLNEEGIITTVCTPDNNNLSDLFTMNFPVPYFNNAPIIYAIILL